MIVLNKYTWRFWQEAYLAAFARDGTAPVTAALYADKAVKEFDNKMSNNKVLDSVTCGFRKWSISVDENYNVIVAANHDPIDVGLTLGDVSVNELRALGEMFLGLARRIENNRDKSAEINQC